MDNKHDLRIRLFENPMAEGKYIDNLNDTIEIIKNIFKKNTEKGNNECSIEFVWTKQE